MRSAAVAGPADFPDWRRLARALLAADVPPEAIEWCVAGDAPGLFAANDAAPAEPPAALRVPRAFVDLAEVAIRHRDPERFALLYGLLWRSRREPGLLATPTDADVHRLESMARAVRRDAHKMHAFVRFRELATPDGPRYVAWFEPDHHIVHAEAGFFARRFATMRWSILTPEASAHWDLEDITFGPGGTKADAPSEDAAEELWRGYYASIFNPARLKPAAMRAEMPRKYWKNLPEAALIPQLMADAPRRVAAMVARGATAPALRRQRDSHLTVRHHAPVPEDAMDLLDTLAGTDPVAALAALRRELGAFDSPLARLATQAVPGEGPLGAPLMLVGEQPGDEEDLAGRPFVGPAGRLLDRALAEAGIERPAAYLTNAVKHFKFTPTGKRRIHAKPDTGEVVLYRPFLRREIALVGPKLLVALGATAARALTGRAVAVTKQRGEVVGTEDGVPAFLTVHPSYLLRLPDEAAKRAEYARFVADLTRAREIAAA